MSDEKTHCDTAASEWVMGWDDMLGHLREMTFGGGELRVAKENETLRSAGAEAIARAEKAEAEAREHEVTIGALEALRSEASQRALAAEAVIDSAWQATDVASAVRGLTTLADVVTVYRDARREAEAAAGQMRATLEYLRPEVRAFARAMEVKLRENDWKGGWKADRAVDLMSRVEEEAEELAEVISFSVGFDPIVILREATDVANMAMMVVDVCGGLIPEPLTTNAGRGYQSPEQVAQACAAARDAALDEARARVCHAGFAHSPWTCTEACKRVAELKGVTP